MNQPVQTTFRNLGHSVAIEARVQEEAEKLDKYFDRITSCRVVIEAPHKDHRRGNPFHVHITLGVPGRELVVAHEPSWRAAVEGGKDVPLQKHREVEVAHKDLHVAIRDSFLALRRQLQDYVHCLRQEVKAHHPAEVASE